jgi:chitinase
MSLGQIQLKNKNKTKTKIKASTEEKKGVETWTPTSDDGVGRGAEGTRFNAVFVGKVGVVLTQLQAIVSTVGLHVHTRRPS